MGIFKAFKGEFADLLLWDEQRSLMSRVHRFVDLWNLSLDVGKHRRLLEKVFGRNSIDESSFNTLMQASTRSSSN